MEPGRFLRDAVAVSKLKIRWAKHHMEGVESCIKHVVSQNDNIIKLDNNFGRAKITIGPNKWLPIDLAMHLGDAVHNLNCVTDYLWTALDKEARLAHGNIVDASDVARVSFPRHETLQNLTDLIDRAIVNKKAIYTVFPQARNFIINEVKPYKIDGDPSIIWTLNKLDNINKHRFLLTAVHILRFDGLLELTNEGKTVFRFGNGTNIITPNYPFVAEFGFPVELRGETKAVVDVIFSEPEYFSHSPVLEALFDMMRTVAELVEKFEKTFV